MENMLQNIYSDILEISSLETQKSVWLGKDSKCVSSYTEVMCRLFDDNHFDNFIDKTSFEMGFSEKLIYEMKKLRDLLNLYKAKDTDEEIINDSNWKVIIEQAKLVVQAWNEIMKNRLGPV